jgi:hypothetical protein
MIRKKFIAKKYTWHNEPANTSVKISQNFTEVLFTKALKKTKSMTNLSNITGLSKQTLFNNMYRKSMSVRSLGKLLTFCEINFGETNYFIEEIAENEIKLPIDLSSKAAAIIFSAILGDGSNSTRVMYKNKDKNLILKVERNAKKLLGNIKLDHRISSKGIPYILFPRITGRILNYVGIPTGKQMNFNPGIPEVILNSSKKAKKMFIQQFFDDEGWPEPNKWKIAASQCSNVTSDLTPKFIKSIKSKAIVYLNDIPKEIKLKLTKPRLLVDIKEILKEDFDIYSNIRFKRLLVRKKHITGAFELEICRKSEVPKFAKRINFSSPNKKSRLKFMLNRSNDYPKNITLLIINEAIQLSKRDGFFLAYEIANKLCFPHPPIRKRLSTMVKKGIFENRNGKYFLNIKF